MKSRVHPFLMFAFTAGLLSGCSGSDTVPIITPSGPTATADDQRTPQSDALTSQEAALISQAESEPVPAPLPDL
jgi:hypothetical protein